MILVVLVALQTLHRLREAMYVVEEIDAINEAIRHIALNDVDNIERNDSIRLDNKCKTNVVATRAYHAYGWPLLLK